jgi:transposase InsO family protein
VTFADVAISLLNPAPDAILRRLEFSRQLGDRSPGSRQLDDPLPVLLRIRWSTLWHRKLLSPPGYSPKRSGVYETGATSVRERRDQLRHPHYAAPELLATGPNELWSWDITKLAGPAKWTYFYLYVILDVFSRSVVGWMVAHRESAALAEKLIRETCSRQGIVAGQLTVHADRGSSMTSKAVALLLSDLGVTKSHSRPHVSNDNPFSEAQFKTLKYRPEFPDRFGSIEDARAFCQAFFTWYNTEHRHGGIGLLTPEDVHLGRAASRIAARAEVLALAYAAHPERFVHGLPQPAIPPTAVWINPPKSSPSAFGEKTDLVGSPQSNDHDPGEHLGTPNNSALAASISLSTPSPLH